jgi:hypothetical protein
MPPRTCIHELDVVALRSSAIGFDPAGREVHLAAGSTGTVVREQAGSSWVEVEIAEDSTGAPQAFVEIERAGLTLLHALDRSAA